MTFETTAKAIADAVRPLAPSAKLEPEDIPYIDALARNFIARMPVIRRINEAGLEIVKEFEGLRLTAYQDVAGIWTIGYGSTKGVKEGMQITLDEALARLKSDLDEAERGVNTAAPIATDNQFSAMVSLAFNIGVGAFQRSTVLKRHNAGNYAGAAKAFGMWVRSGGKVRNGLIRRREAEAELYARAS